MIAWMSIAAWTAPLASPPTQVTVDLYVPQAKLPEIRCAADRVVMGLCAAFEDVQWPLPAGQRNKRAANYCDNTDLEKGSFLLQSCADRIAVYYDELAPPAASGRGSDAEERANDTALTISADIKYSDNAAVAEVTQLIVQRGVWTRVDSSVHRTCQWQAEPPFPLDINRSDYVPNQNTTESAVHYQIASALRAKPKPGAGWCRDQSDDAVVVGPTFGLGVSLSSATTPYQVAFGGVALRAALSEGRGAIAVDGRIGATLGGRPFAAAYGGGAARLRVASGIRAEVGAQLGAVAARRPGFVSSLELGARGYGQLRMHGRRTTADPVFGLEVFNVGSDFFAGAQFAVVIAP